MTEHLDVVLTVAERELLAQGLLEWGGPAHCTEALAAAMGFASVEDLLRGSGPRIARAIRARAALSRADWRRALLATEIVFVSDVVGSGIDWSTTTGLEDSATIQLLRQVQRKLT
jgi:hypothetical protein